MLYRERFGKYEIIIGGITWKWFTTYENALKEFNRLAKYPDELDGDMELVNMETKDVLASVEAVED